MPKAFLIDTTRCTACRGCQVACKEWKNLPPVATKQTGTHQNPPDLTPFNFKLVRFSEHLDGGVVSWYFFPDQCRHCLDAPCKMAASDPEAIIQDADTGAVIYTDKTAKEDFNVIRGACPYDIPRQNPDTKALVKCDMCIDRVKANMLPMCVKSCAMGAMNFGSREEMLALAEKRLAEVKKTAPKAQLLNPKDVAVIYLVADDPKKYWKNAMAQAPSPLTRQQFLAKAFSPIRSITRSISG
ncbi:formate dehydrogenase [Desulfovibrio sulfodismutans]|uniref:Formate dehydrogenase n=1 Tax=Desulfolutivibrio sulfodismutans TaxID=63561 RepID=A0A7K3NG61_9BACT|nr:4Fe-4S dicluster domain-containing protein [Desulfolutivibrio sulfodismutans]NDY55170.1 formate dehydrogenase [Desulfolutivibrio sulfodismutans]QLA12139.1 formate dehydrogenase [Desulfolutivibrio sulfodismutans DSM 3696]